MQPTYDIVAGATAGVVLHVVKYNVFGTMVVEDATVTQDMIRVDYATSIDSSNVVR